MDTPKFDISTANCGAAPQPDFVVFNTSVNGTSTQASVVACENLYSGCGGNVPSTYWAYNTGGSVVTSVALSLDGSQVAFVQSSQKWERSNSRPLPRQPYGAHEFERARE